MGSKLFKIYSECHYFFKNFWRSEGLAEKTFSVMGAGLVGYYFLKFGKRIFNYIRPVPFSLSYRYGAGSWVVITGATSPLGRSFALDFARRGFSLCLMGRSREKLETLEREISEISQFVQVKVIATDFKQSLSPMYFTELFEQLKTLDISILINNASVDFFDYFTESTNPQLQELFCVNMLAVVMITHYLVRKMLHRKFCSAIINLSSCDGVFPSAFVSVYSASKAFVDAFSSELGRELQGKVDVLALRPYWIRSNLPPMLRKMLTASADSCVKSCLDQLSKGYTTYGHPKHALVGVFKEALPEWVRDMGSRITKPLSIEEKRKVAMRYERRRKYL